MTVRGSVYEPPAMYSSSLASASPANRTHAVAQEDGHRVVVGLGKELVWQRGDDVLDNFTRRRSLPLVVSGARWLWRGTLWRQCTGKCVLPTAWVSKNVPSTRLGE
jgi:hypothetical protein